MRPSPIVSFERIALLAYVLGLLNFSFYWREWFERPHGRYPMATFCLSQIIYFGVYALLIWLIGRRGNRVARWIFVVLVAGAALLVLFVGLPPPSSWPVLRTILVLGQCLLALSSVVFLFGSDTKFWFDGRQPPVDAEIFH
jgi:glucan phosphoethanolaminetransferase (alkaline phosphatase superfamily)